MTLELWGIKAAGRTETCENSTRNDMSLRWNRQIAGIVLSTHIHTVTGCTDAAPMNSFSSSLSLLEARGCLDTALSRVRWYSQAAASQKQAAAATGYNQPSVALQLLQQRWNWRWMKEPCLQSLLKTSGKFNVHLNSYPSPPSAAWPISSRHLWLLSCFRPGSSTRKQWLVRISFWIWAPNASVFLLKKPC